jgi:uncharacterized membrane protein YphA (DoxX/SURF4 family)
MFTALLVVSILFAAMLVFSATGKLNRMPKVVASLSAVGVKDRHYPFLASLEIAAAIGLLIGLWVAPLGIAAAIGSVLYFIGAIIAHLRVRDTKGLAGPLVPLALAVASLVLRIATA